MFPEQLQPKLYIGNDKLCKSPQMIDSHPVMIVVKPAKTKGNIGSIKVAT